ncbi:MAG: hypothetical protein ACI9SP_004631 [Arenicella sp.]|jgi:hypothetical protein
MQKRSIQQKSHFVGCFNLTMELMMKKNIQIFTALCFLGTVSAQTFACGIQGTAVNSDGSKINGSGTVLTSWNSKKAFPKNGEYRLDLGDGVCGEKITVYLNDGGGSQTVRVNGWTTVNLRRR